MANRDAFGRFVSGSGSNTLEINVRANDMASRVLANVGRSFQRFGDSIKEKVGEIATGAFRKMGEELISLPSRLVSFGHEMLEEADRAQKLAAALQTSTESLTALQFAAKQSGIEQGELATSGKAMLKAIQAARDGAKEQSEAFEALGIDARKLARDQVDLVDIFARVADGVNAIQDPVERASTLLRVFGKSGNELANLFKEGGAGIRAMAKDAQELGIVLDRELIERADKAGDEMNRLNSAIKGTFFSVLKELLPQFTENMRTLTQFIKENKQQIIDAFVSIGSKIVDAMGAAGRAVLKVADVFQEAIHGFRLSLAAIKVAVAEISAGPGALHPFGRFAGAGGDTGALQQAQQDLATLVSQTPDVGKLTEAYDKFVEELSDIAKRAPEAAAGVEKLNVELAKQPAFIRGIADGFGRFSDALFDLRAQGESTAIQALTGVRDFGTGVIIALSSGAANLRSNLRAVTEDMLRMLQRLAAEMAANAFLRALFGGIGGAVGGAGGAGFVPGLQGGSTGGAGLGGLGAGGNSFNAGLGRGGGPGGEGERLSRLFQSQLRSNRPLVESLRTALR